MISAIRGFILNFNFFFGDKMEELKYDYTLFAGDDEGGEGGDDAGGGDEGGGDEGGGDDAGGGEEGGE
tara:strand:+ start:5700 stop:5903 length:204 start_codon:yes stop_codon:yes gene_type:complete